MKVSEVKVGEVRDPKLDLVPNILKVLREAKRWGVTVRVVPNDTVKKLVESQLLREQRQHWTVAPNWLRMVTAENPDVFHKGPFAGGIRTRWGKPPAVYWPWDHTLHSHYAEALVHEVAHVVFGRQPDHVLEEDMIALEREMHRRLKLNWSYWMNDFGIGEGELWSELATKERGALLRRSLDVLRKKGLLDEQGKPTYKRVIPSWEQSKDES